MTLSDVAEGIARNPVKIFEKLATNAAAWDMWLSHDLKRSSPWLVLVTSPAPLQDVQLDVTAG